MTEQWMLNGRMNRASHRARICMVALRWAHWARAAAGTCEPCKPDIPRIPGLTRNSVQGRRADFACSRSPPKMRRRRRQESQSLGSSRPHPRRSALGGPRALESTHGSCQRPTCHAHAHEDHVKPQTYRRPSSPRRLDPVDPRTRSAASVAARRSSTPEPAAHCAHSYWRG